MVAVLKTFSETLLGVVTILVRDGSIVLKKSLNFLAISVSIIFI